MTERHLPQVRPTSLFVILLATALIAALWHPKGATVSAAASYINTTTNSTCLNTEERAFLKLVNDYRASKGIAPLTATKSLNMASYTHSLDLGKRAYFAHDTKLPLPAGQSGAKFSNRMTDAGYTYSTYRAENIAAGHSTALKVFNAWKASSGHNANMLNTNYKAIGIGFATVSGSPYTNYWTTNFGGVVDAGSGC